MAQLWYKKGEALIQTSASKKDLFEKAGFKVVDGPEVATPKDKPAPKKETKPKEEKVRARDDKGHFIADDPKTPENEAYVSKSKAKKK